MSNHSNPAVIEAQKQIGAVLEDLEAKTGGDVRKIGLQDMVDDDPKSGAPVVQKTVEIQLQEKAPKRWST